MPNPILTQLIGRRANASLNSIGSLKEMLSNGNPNAIYNQMMNSNPQFRQFVQQNQGKSPEQIASNYGIDLNQIRNLFR